MRKSRNKLVTLLLLSLLFSCNAKSELGNIFITDKNDYWQYKNDCGSHGVYFKFYDNGHYDKFNRFIDSGFELFNNDGDLISDKRTWSIKNDSTFIWDKGEYRIEFFNKDSVILSYTHYKEKQKKCRVTLKKVADK